MSLTTDIVPGRSIVGPKGDTKLDRIARAVIADVNESTGRTLNTLSTLPNTWDSDGTGDLGNLLAKTKRSNMIMDHRDDTNIMHIYDITSQVIAIRYIAVSLRTRCVTADGLRLAGRNSQNRRGEQNAAEKGELGDHGGDDELWIVDTTRAWGGESILQPFICLAHVLIFISSMGPGINGFLSTTNLFRSFSCAPVTDKNMFVISLIFALDVTMLGDVSRYSFVPCPVPLSPQNVVAASTAQHAN